MVWRGDSSGRVARSLLTLLDQVDAKFPGRDRSSDGTIGDASHRARKSEHNKDANGIVRALDITNDPAHGLSSRALAEALLASRDRRLWYVISNGEIAASNVEPKWGWRPYKGSSPHTGHMHISVVEDPALYDDDRPWSLDALAAPSPADRREISRGSVGADVRHLQELLHVDADGIFGLRTARAVRAFQAGSGLSVDGIVGPRTWAALLSRPPAAMKLPLDAVDDITALAAGSEIARYAWKGRGRAPIGYVKGMAVAYGLAYADLGAGGSVARAMAAPTGSAATDALAWYGMEAVPPGTDTLRALFALLIGLGMRESSGRYCEGRDRSAQNTTADTAEAGLFQQSWDSAPASPELPGLLDLWSSTSADGLRSIFEEGVESHPGDDETFGTGDGAAFQTLAKSHPLFAVQAAAIGLRVLRQHWGPINRREVEIRPEADRLLLQVQDVIDALATPAPDPIDPPAEPDIVTPAENPELDACLREITASIRPILERHMAPVPAQRTDIDNLLDLLAKAAANAKAQAGDQPQGPIMSPLDAILGGQKMMGWKTITGAIGALTTVFYGQQLGMEQWGALFNAALFGFLSLGGAGAVAKWQRGQEIAERALDVSRQTLEMLKKMQQPPSG